MRAVLALVPYALSAVFYGMVWWRLFRKPPDPEPDGWQVDVLLPVAIACTVPLASLLAERPPESVIGVLTVGLLTLIILMLVVVTTPYYRMTQSVHVGRFDYPSVTGANVALVVGLLAILGTGIAAVVWP